MPDATHIFMELADGRLSVEVGTARVSIDRALSTTVLPSGEGGAFLDDVHEAVNALYDEAGRRYGGTR